MEQSRFNTWIQAHYGGASSRTHVLKEVLVQPFQDLLNRPSGGEAYCGGVIFRDPTLQPALRHFRGYRAIDRPLMSLLPGQPLPLRLEGRQFWCGPLAFHFGHQIADFASRVLVASVDPRGGELLWCPWRAGSCWDELLPWQQFLLTYLNPGGKPHRICTQPVLVKELVVVPQQARMRASPTLAHLRGLCRCEQALKPRRNEIVYVSRARYAPCTDSSNLLGAFAAETLFEKYLSARGVSIIYPESLGLKEQLEIYLGAEVLIFAEGSAQHGLELLGFHPDKRVFVICRRPQLEGMALPLKSRFPNVCFIEALSSQWQSAEGVPWDGLALLDWFHVANSINPYLPQPLTSQECLNLEQASENHLRSLAERVSLISLSSVS